MKPFRPALSWPLAVLFLSSLMSCGGEGSEIPSPDDMSASSAPAPRTDVLRLAPEAPTQCGWESGFRISPDSIGPLATTDPVGVVKELCPQAQFFYRLRGITFLMENLDVSALVKRNIYGFRVLSSSVPDSATIRGVSVRGVTIRGVGRSFFPPHCGQLYDLDSFEDHLRCAELGEAIAQTNVGYAYKNGDVVPKDDTEAVRWFRLAAEQGSAPGQFSLGRMYADGEGGPQDLAYAYMLFDLAAAQGNRSGQREKDLIEQRMTREEMAEAQRLSREWIDAAVETAASPSVEAPPPTQVSFPFSYRDSTEVDLTGDGVSETLRLTASGPRPLGLGVSFSIWFEGQEIYQRSWDSPGYFRYEPELVMSEPGDSVLYAHVRDQLDSFFDSSAFMVVPPAALNADHSRPPFDPPAMDNDPVKLISGQLLRAVLQDSLSAAGMDSTSAFRQARSLAYRSRQQHPEAQGIWDLMTAQELLTFRFNAGDEANQRIAWSQTNSRFFNVWACC